MRAERNGRTHLKYGNFDFAIVPTHPNIEAASLEVGAVEQLVSSRYFWSTGDQYSMSYFSRQERQIASGDVDYAIRDALALARFLLLWREFLVHFLEIFPAN